MYLTIETGGTDVCPSAQGPDPQRRQGQPPAPFYFQKTPNSWCRSPIKLVLLYAIEQLVECGIRDIGIVVGDTGDQIRAAVGDGSGSAPE